MRLRISRISMIAVLVLLVLAPRGALGTGTASAAARGMEKRSANSPAAAVSPYTTTLSYVIRFYPRWFTYFQQSIGGVNKLAGPATMSPQLGVVVAPNDDTVYALAFVDLSAGPQIFTIPSTRVTYSLLVLDVWGNVVTTNIQAQTPGAYALVQPGWQGTLPKGVTAVPVPYRLTMWIVRADKHTSSGQDVTAEARAFRAALRLASLAAYQQDPASGATQVVPTALLSPQTKAIADEEIASTPTIFLRTLQQGMHAATTQPLSASDRALSRAFDRVFAAAQLAAQDEDHGPMSQIVAAVRDAHTLIIDRWQAHVGETRWVYFGNVGEWGTAYLDRAAATEYLQLGNNTSAAAYDHAFTDDQGVPLNGAVTTAYTLTFRKDQIPQAKRFWSLTAYIPPGITLYPNSLDKYNVASYTPGLQKNPDGSLTIYIQPSPPTNAPQANWLPVPSGPFSLILRVYGPEGNTASGSYVPPAILRYGLR